MTTMLEVDRVAAHIARAESLAATRDLTPLSRAQRLVRALLLQALADYRAAGRFPLNRDFARQTPYFIDATGTRCAMAHLMELGGEQPLVAKLAATRNNAYVRELADEPAVLAWLAAAGLTVEEAAAIQPSYCEVVASCICGGDFSHIEYPVPARGVLEGTMLANGKLRVDHTYGDAFGIATGSEVTIASEHAAGTVVVAPIASATATIHGVALEAQSGEYACQSQGVSSAPALSAEELAEAVMANDCVGALKGQSSDWGRSSCEGEIGDPGDTNGGGCSASPADASVGILLALVAALARRR
jgi:uncharacterized protein (TIGR03382 family)